AHAQAEEKNAQRALDQAAGALHEQARQPNPEKKQNAAAAARAAADAMSSLQDAVSKGGAADRLGQAYGRREALKKEAEEMERLSQGKGTQSGQRAQASAKNAKEASRGLATLVEGTDVGDSFPGPLPEALSPERQAARERALDALAGAREA